MATTHSLPLLSQARIASPCTMRWEDMEGDDRTRFCSSCSLHVHNISTLSPSEAEELLAKATGTGERLCAIIYRRADGTILTRDCPVGVALAKARVRRAVVRIASAIGILTSAGVLGAAGQRSDGMLARLRSMRPVSYLASWLAPVATTPPPVMAPMAGEICVAPIPAPAPAP